MPKNFKLLIEYDGSAYHGWQRQKDLPTIQEEIENAVYKMTGQNISLIGSGRTDAGVHALGQVAHFSCRTRLLPKDFQRGLNSLLKGDIVIKECVQVDADFHARYHVKGKTYHYRILNHSIPEAVGRQYAWFISRPLDVSAMRTAAESLVGTHDFKAFEGTGSPRSDTIRTIIRAELTEKKRHYLQFEIEANGFLRFMVRNLVGTLVEVGLGKRSANDMERIRISKDRSQAGATAPPHGLFLISVQY